MSEPSREELEQRLTALDQKDREDCAAKIQAALKEHRCEIIAVPFIDDGRIVVRVDIKNA